MDMGLTYRSQYIIKLIQNLTRFAPSRFVLRHLVELYFSQGKRYQAFMDGCAKAFSKRECESTEYARFKMSLEQPATQYNYTKIGFKKVKTPESVFSLLRDFWETNKANKRVEQWGRAYTYTNNWDVPTHMVSVEDGGLRGAGAHLKAKIWDYIKPIIEEWTGHKLKPTSIYGIREYGPGAILSTHVDRLPLVSSCIINVAQDLNEPWPLEVYDHDGKAHNVTMEPGDLVLYEVHHFPSPLPLAAHSH
jgi:prolyl 4-hydroxylase